MADTEQVIAKGTRVEITDVMHRFCGLQAEIIDHDRGEHMPRTVRVATTHEGFAFPQQYKVLSEPEPTIGQLVDRMHEAAKTGGHNVVRFDLDEGYGEGDYRYGRVAVWTNLSGMDAYCSHGQTPQAALTAMIERLEGMK